MASLEGWWTLETADRLEWELFGPSGAISRMAGYGLPRGDWATQATPTGHGSAPIAFRLPPREVVVGVVIPARYGERRDGLAYRRQQDVYPILSWLAGPLKIKFVGRDRRQRELRYVQYGGGMELDTDRADIVHGNESVGVLLTAHDPIWYNPSSRWTYHYYADFTHGVYADTIALDYTDGIYTDGDWYCYPYIRIRGPCTSFDLQSQTTGQRLRYLGTIPSGAWVNINCNPFPSALSATNNDGENVENYIPPSDDFGGFSLWPKPLAETGYNEWTIQVEGTAAGFYVAVMLEDRYQGL